MFKTILAFFVMLYAAVAFAAVDVNKASAADLDGLKGIGPAISGRIIDERKKGNFKDWNDFIQRVKGVGEGNAAKFSAEGMTVDGSAYKAATAAPAAKAAATDKKDAKADAKAKKDADKMAKAEEKKTKADEAKAKKDAAMKPKADATVVKADAAKPAASAAKK